MSLVRAIQFRLWFYMQARAAKQMLRLTHWEDQFKYKVESDLWDIV